MRHGYHTLLLAIGLPFAAATLCAQSATPDSAAADVAKNLQNPVADQISVPIESTWEFGAGPGHAADYSGSVKPVIPFHLGSDWLVITRTILPFSYSVLPDKGSGSHVGVGDSAATVYLSPTRPARGWFWGIGPALIFPSATDQALGSGKWSAGPTGVVLTQRGPWTFVTLVGQARSFAGGNGRDPVNTTVLQPSLSYTTERNTTFGIDTASTYDWTARVWTVPLEVSVSQVLEIGRQSMSVGLTARSHLDPPVSGPTWGVTFTATFVFPKRH